MQELLVVDDEPQAVEILEEFLTAKGYAVIGASVGEEAPRRLNEESVGREALKMGAYDYISKPLDFDYLERVLWVKITTMTL